MKHSIETKVKISASCMGRTPWNKGKRGVQKYSREHFDRLHAFHCGRKRSTETRHKISMVMKGKIRPNLQGNLNPSWKGGVTAIQQLIRSSIRYAKWRGDIFRRDKYRCVKCRSRKEIQAHHRKEFYRILRSFIFMMQQLGVTDKLCLVSLASGYKPFWYLKNGQTLCKCCHKTTKSYLRGGE